MKTKIVSGLSVAAMLSVAMFSVAAAQYGVNVGANANVEVRVQGNATSTAAQAEARGNATSAAARSKNATDTNENANDNGTSTDANAGGQLTAAAHRSAVASFVQSLLSVADREGGIGAQVRVVAQAQNDSASSSSEAIAKIESRSALKTLFIGSDYKNLGILRSEMVKTENNIEQLKNLVAQATSDADKAELNAQIKVLVDLQAKEDLFIKANESKFSFFGWFVKLFAK